MGIFVTVLSFLRSSKIVAYVLLGGTVLLLAWRYIRGREKAAVTKALNRELESAIKRMERNREVHNEIRRLPLSERARRLRELDAPE